MFTQNSHEPKSESLFTRGVNPFLGKKDKEWSTRDEQSAEDEVSEFLYGLIRLIKPSVVIETGCYEGDTTEAMAIALKDNNFGKLYACDIDSYRVKKVRDRISTLGLPAQILCMTGRELILQMGSVPDFAFIDSSPDGKIRGEEINTLLPFLRPLSMFALHDTAPQHPTIASVAGMINLPKVYLNTPRGLTLFQKI